MSLQFLIPPSWNDDGRRAARLGVRFKAALRETGATKFDVDVIDMSISGFRFETAYTLHIGVRVWLTVPGFSGFESTVAWRNNHLYGCRFEAPLHQAVLDHIIAQHQNLK